VPYVRFSRDKRGYEHTYLVSTPNQRGGGKQAQSRVLYWFRTPPGIRVGRVPFDRDTQRVIEAQNPGIVFDWPRLIASAVPPPVVKDAEHWREKRRAERAVKRARVADVAEPPAGEDEADALQEVDLLEEAQEVEEQSVAAESHEGADSEPSSSPVPLIAAEPVASGSPEQGPGSRRRRRRRGGRRRHRPQGETGAPGQATPGADASKDQAEQSEPGRGEDPSD
jgi:hypothetical protein